MAAKKTRAQLESALGKAIAGAMEAGASFVAIDPCGDTDRGDSAFSAGAYLGGSAHIIALHDEAELGENLELDPAAEQLEIALASPQWLYWLDRQREWIDNESP